jgi:indole-3-glycerol phosphate synthase
MSRLADIISVRKQRVAAAKDAAPREVVERSARSTRESAQPHALLRALAVAEPVRMIAEFKRRSPSKGTIKGGADAVEIARQYQRGGAAAISVLTEPDYFDGSLDDLREIRRTVTLPILRKDFIIDPYQVYESAAAGADALLLIVAALNDAELSALRRITEDELGMDALVEVHTADEMQRALNCGATIIGVNNRDLATFEVSLDTSIDLARGAESGTILVSESGIQTIEDINRLRAAGYRGFLIGETLMRAAHPEQLLAEFTDAHAAVKLS